VNPSSEPVVIEWRMKASERQKAGDAHWKKHSESDRLSAQTLVPTYNYNSSFFEYRIRPVKQRKEP
jgi:hypothetical protein